MIRVARAFVRVLCGVVLLVVAVLPASGQT
jgi:hypothetical protein